MDERLSIAPMMELTDPHYRMLMRFFTKKTVLYTEMVVDDTVIHSPGLNFLLGKNIQEEPSIMQIGGSDPENIAKASAIVEQYGGGYGEINLNCGCPSPRVSLHCFGAKLMMKPDLVREIVYTMQRRVSVPVSVKCRIGADEMDSYDELTNFIRTVSSGGVSKFIVHARKCLLNGLSPKQNRDIPPLRYEVVHRLTQDFPELKFVINGGINSLEQAQEHLDHDYTYQIPQSTTNELIYKKLLKNGLNPSRYGVFSMDTTSAEEVLDNTPVPVYETLPAVHGVMIGRQAYANPVMFATADSEFFGTSDPGLTRREVLDRYCDYCEWAQSDEGPRYTVKGNKVITVTSSVLLNAMRNVMHGLQGQQRWRVALNDTYMERIKGINGEVNPSVREVVSLICLSYFIVCILQVGSQQLQSKGSKLYSCARFSRTSSLI